MSSKNETFSRQRSVLFHLPKSPALNIEFKNIAYTVQMGFKNVERRILKGVSGEFVSGELTAIMGPSGAGKSSLLNILTGFQKKGVTGNINSKNFSRSAAQPYRKESCYILQDDHLPPLFTVDEMMKIAADLKLGSSLSEKAKYMVIYDILDALGLILCRDTRCSQLSGGQKKRLSIALELIDNPPIMFLDEPTTGLDSLSSFQCIALLKALAKGGRTIVCTIHQPSANLYEMFDHVYVLAKGLCVYQGSSLNTVAYMASNNLQCPEYHNPADFLLEVTNGEYGDYTDQLAKSAHGAWRNVDEKKRRALANESNGINGIGKQESRSGLLMSKTDQNGTEKALVMINQPSEWLRFWILLNRAFVQMYRDWSITYVKLILHFLTGCFCGVLFFKMGNDASKTIPNMSYLMMTVVYLSYTSAMPAVLRYPLEINMIKKERFNNWYHLKTYYIASMAINIPVQILSATAYLVISYYMTDQPLEWFRFFSFQAMSIGACLLFETYGLILGVMLKNPVNGVFVGAVGVAAMILFAGFVVFLSHMPTYMYYVSYLSFMRYAYEGVALSVFGFNRTELLCPDLEIYCHYRNPKILLADMGMELDRFWFDFAMLFGIFILLRFVVFFALRKRLDS